MCPECGEEEETAYHFLDECNAAMIVCYSIFGAYLMEASELQQVQPHTLLRFASLLESQLKEIYITFRLSRGCTLGWN